MPTEQVQQENSEQRRVQRQLDQHLREVHTHARRANNAQREAQEANRKREKLENENPDFVGLDTLQAVSYLILNVGFLAVCLLDIFLFSPAAAYIADRAFPESPLMKALMPLVVPCLILLVDMIIAIQMFFSRVKAEEENTWWRYWAWAAVATIFTFVMPALVVATRLAAQPDNPTPRLEMILGWQQFALTVIVVGAHAVVLFGGRPAHLAKGYALFRCQRSHWDHQARQANTLFEHEAQAAVNAFSAYLRLLNDYNERHPNAHIAPGPFDRITRDLINDRFGYEVIRGPNDEDQGNNGRVAPPPPPPLPSHAPSHRNSPPPPDDGEDTDNEYLRSVLSERTRDAEDEVRI
jgi:hypothetical protein